MGAVVGDDLAGLLGLLFPHQDHGAAHGHNIGGLAPDDGGFDARALQQAGDDLGL